MGKRLIGGDWDNFTEPAYTKPADEVLRVFPGDNPPEGYLSEDALVDMLIKQAQERRAARIPKNKAEAEVWKEQHGQGFFPIARRRHTGGERTRFYPLWYGRKRRLCSGTLGDRSLRHR